MSQDQKPPPAEGSALWYKDAIIYEVHVRAFSDSNADGIGDFEGLIEKLDYLQDLGVTAIWLLPFYPSPLRDGGYDIADYTNINPVYGTRREFARLLREAHRRDLRVITELVINHTSNEHEWFQRARTAPKGSRWRDFYVWSDTPHRYKDARIIFKDFETSNWAWDPVANAYYWHRFYSHQPDLNFENPDVHAAVFKVVDFWLEMGVDGLRLDAVPYLYERDGTNCENLPETHEFLRKLRRHIDANFADRMLLAEANQWPADAAAYFGQGDECHMNFHFPLMPRMFMAVELEDSFPIVNILKQTPVVHETCQWATFLRNHDELTLEMVTDEDRDYMYRVYAQEHTARINLGIRRRLAPLMKTRRRIELMNALLFSLPGTPVLYYGDEIGMGDNIYLGDRDGVRTPMQWSADRNAGFSRANPQKLYLPIIIDPEYHYEAINVEAQQQNPSSLLWWMKRLITLRKQNKVLGRGTIEFLHPDNSKVLAFIRAYGDERVLIVANLSRYAQHVELDLTRFAGMVPVELFGRNRFPEITSRCYPLSLGRYDFFWFALEPATPVAIGDSQAAPSLSAKGSWRALLSTEGRKALEPALAKFITARRWFRGKARTRRTTAIADIIPLARDERSPAEHYLLLVRIEYTDGMPETYVVPVGFAAGDRARELATRWRNAVIAEVTVRDPEPEQAASPEGILHDALATPEFAALLLTAIRTRAVATGRAGELHALPLLDLETLGAEGELLARISESEQSNTTIIYGDKLLLKVFRQVEEGINPELEIGKFLTEQEFAFTPRLAGALEYQGRGRESTAVAMLQEYVPSQSDAWTSTLESLNRYFERVLADEESVKASAPPMPAGTILDASRVTPPALVTQLMGNDLVRMRLLGERTAQLHLTLAGPSKDPAFGQQPFTTLHQQSLFQSAHGMLARTFGLLRKRERALPDGVREHAAAMLQREAEIDAKLQQILSKKFDVTRIRSHGDFHLGQVLSTGDDFILIDFEGEPARPLIERRYKRCPLRDVSGMLRSFDYAGASALRDGRLRPEDVAALKPWTDAWVAWISASYLAGYVETVTRAQAATEARADETAPIVPASDADTVLLLDFYMLEKCIYEVGYELNNRPDWLDIPLRGLEQLITPRA
ncbi:alpha-amylase [Sorangium cellulosum]|uniref:Maltokinase n=1 Tax=Sorangium cellulosum TaxID=56 RepID=A0A4P2PUC0_SORCE|nr:maltose alpha-D-glucosyltransferase [Sorangium cellulosum]AUX19973.1 alpha-amylase [Sorangium cellulosum]